MMSTRMIAHVFLYSLFITVNCLLIVAAVNSRLSTEIIEPTSRGKTKTSSHLNTTMRISGGQRINIKDFPYFAIVKAYFQEGMYRKAFECGGGIIGKKWILTAAHCVRNKSVIVEDVKVAVGVDYKSGLTLLPSAHWYVHEGFNAHDVMDSNDIALIELSQELQYSDSIQSVRLPNKNTTNEYEGKTAMVAGYGYISNTTKDSHLRAISIPIIGEKECRRYRRIRSFFFCAGRPSLHKDTCEGDSGGPLIVKDKNGPVVVGITSHGDPICGNFLGPSVHSKVSYYIDWICSKMKC